MCAALLGERQVLAMEERRKRNGSALRTCIAVLGLVLPAAYLGAGPRSAVQDGPPAIRLVETLRIGDEAAGDGVVFGDIGGLVAVDSKDRIFVGERQDPQIYVFTPEGDLLRSIGEKGRGPGEFSRLSGVRTGPGDTLYAFDSRLRRITAFEPASLDFAYDIKVAEDEGSRPARGLIGAHAEGYVVTYEDLPLPGMDFETERFLYARLVTRSGQPADEPIVRVPSSQFMMVVRGSRFVGVAMPFSPFPVIYLAPDGHIFSGYTESVDVSVTAVSGGERGFIRHALEPVPITDSELEAWIGRLSDEASGILRSSDLRETKPACSTFIADDHGRIWVSLTSADAESTTAQWLVLDAQSRVAGQVALPSSVTLEVIAGGRAYAIDEGDDGLALVVYEIVE